MNTQLLLEKIGGQAAIAKECQISDAAVSQWSTEDKLPKARQQYLRLAHPGPHWAEYEAYLAEKAKAGEKPGTESQGHGA